MEQKELLETLQKVIIGFSKLIGSNTEIALHDLEKRELVYIINGTVTNRQIGYKMNPAVYNTVLNYINEDDYLIGYASHSIKGKKIRASHIIIRNKSGNPSALICINQETTKLEEMRELLDSMIQCQSLNEQPEPEPEDENYIQKITHQVIMNTVKTAKPSSLDTKEAKLEILKKLETKGIFAVKDAVPIVCKTLSISQATLYNYLREIRNQDVLAVNSTPSSLF